MHESLNELLNVSDCGKYFIFADARETRKLGWGFAVIFIFVDIWTQKLRSRQVKVWTSSCVSELSIHYPMCFNRITGLFRETNLNFVKFKVFGKNIRKFENMIRFANKSCNLPTNFIYFSAVSHPTIAISLGLDYRHIHIKMQRNYFNFDREKKYAQNSTKKII